MAESKDLASKQQVKEYYNTFKEHQKKLGVNVRHRTIFKNLRNLGLKPDSNVLEIGCGIGTVSSLILKHVTKGSFVGVDISNESIEVAKNLNATSKNAEFVVNDMSTFTHKVSFDYIVLPDVLEHIPVEQHASIFQTISKLSTKEAIVLINIPEPYTLDWARRNMPEALQIIDQSLSLQDLCNNTYPAGFYLYSVNPYSLKYEPEDYLSVVLKKDFVRQQVIPKQKMKLGIENLRSKLS